MATLVRGSTWEAVVGPDTTQQVWIHLNVAAGQTALLFLRTGFWSLTPNRRFSWADGTEEGWENIVDPGDLYAYWTAPPGNSVIVPYRYVGPPSEHDISFLLQPVFPANIQFGQMLMVLQLGPEEEIVQWVIGGAGGVDESQLIDLPGGSEGAGQLWVAAFPLRQDMGIG